MKKNIYTNRVTISLVLVLSVLAFFITLFIPENEQPQDVLLSGSLYSQNSDLVSSGLFDLRLAMYDPVHSKNILIQDIPNVAVENGKYNISLRPEGSLNELNNSLFQVCYKQSGNNNATFASETLGCNVANDDLVLASCPQTISVIQPQNQNSVSVQVSNECSDSDTSVAVPIFTNNTTGIASAEAATIRGPLASSDEGNSNNGSEPQKLSLDGSSLVLSDGGTVDLSKLFTGKPLTEEQVDAYVANNGYLSEGQANAGSLQLAGDNLSIAGDDNAISLFKYLDNTDRQSVSLNSNTLYLTNGGSISLTKYLDNTDTQNLSLATNTLSLVDGGSVDLSGYLDNTDTLADLSCASGQVPQWNGSAWICVAAAADTDDQTLSIDGSNNLVIVDGNSVSLLAYLDNTDAQDLALSGNTLSVTGDPNTDVDLSGYLDNTDAQAISVASNILSISGNASTVDLSTYLDNTDTQNLSLATNTLSLVDGGSVDLSGYLDNTDTLADLSCASGQVPQWNGSAWICVAAAADTDDQTLSIDGSNNLVIVDGNSVSLLAYLDNTDAQDLALSGNTLSVTGDPNTDVDLSGYLDNTDAQAISVASNILSISGNASTVDLSTYLDNTDTQNLSLATNTLSLVDGGSVDLSGYLDNTDTQDLTLSGNTLAISGDPNTDVDLSGYLDDTTLSEASVEAFIFDADNTGTLSSGTLALSSLSYTGVLTDDEISDTISIGSSGSVADGALTSNVSLLGSTIESTEITNGTITADDLGSNSVDSDELAANSVGASEIATGAVTTDEILNGTIVAGDVASNVFIELGRATTQTDTSTNATIFVNKTGASGNLVQLQEGAADRFVVGFDGTINTASVDSASVANNSLTSDDLATDSVNSDEIASDAVGAAEIATSAVTTTELLNGTILFADIASNGCSNGEVFEYNGSAWVCGIDDNTTYSAGTGISFAGTVISSTLGTTIEGSEITNATITADDLATNSVDSDEVAVDAIGASEISAGAVNISEINTAIAGSGLIGGGGSALAVGDGAGVTINANDIAVNVDGATIEINGSDALKIIDDSINGTQLADTITLDATTTLQAGTNNFSINLDSTGDFVVQDNGVAFATFSDSGVIDFDGQLNVNSNIVLGDAASDLLTFNGTVQGTNVFRFEGSANDANDTIFALINPTALRTITFPDASGEVTLLGQTIEETEITQNTLDDTEIEDNSLTAGSLATDSVAVDEIATGAVTTDEILNGTVVANDVAANVFVELGRASAQVDASTNATIFVNKTGLSGDLLQLQQGASDRFIIGFDGTINTASVDSVSVINNSLSADDLATNSVGNDEIATDAVNSDEIIADAIGASEISAGAVNISEINTAIAGSGLIGGGGSALAVGDGAGVTINANDIAVNVDGATIEINGSDALKIIDDSINGTQLADTITLDATTTLQAGTNNFSINLDSTGDFVVQDNGVAFATFNDNGTIDFDGAVDFNANVILGDAAADLLTFSGTVQGTNVFTFEGSIADANDTIFAITNPTAIRTITFPDATGEASLLGQSIETGEITNGTILLQDIAGNGCNTGQVMQYNGSAWVCFDNDFDITDGTTTSTVAAGDSITFDPTTNGGLESVVTASDVVTYGLRTDCSSFQVLRFNGTAWACADPTGPIAQFTQSSTQSMFHDRPNFTVVNWNTESFKETGITHSNVTNNSRVAFDDAGKYEVSYSIALNADRETYGSCKARLNGTTDINQSFSYLYARDGISEGQAQNTFVITTAADDDYIEILCNSVDTDDSANVTFANRSVLFVERLR